MNLKKLRAALPGAEVSPDGPILERLAARITGNMPDPSELKEAPRFRHSDK